MKLTVYGYEVSLLGNLDFDVDTKDVGVILSIYDWLCEEGFFDSNTFYQVLTAYENPTKSKEIG